MESNVSSSWLSLAHPSADRLFCYAVHTTTDGHSIALEFYYFLYSKIPATHVEIFSVHSSSKFPGQYDWCRLEWGILLVSINCSRYTNGTSVYMFAMVMLHNTPPQSQRRNTTAMHSSHEFLGQLDGSTDLGQA